MQAASDAARAYVWTLAVDSMINAFVAGCHKSTTPAKYVSFLIW